MSRHPFALPLLVAALLVAMPHAGHAAMVEDEFASPSLAGNLLGDPATRSVTVYLPPSYDTSPAQLYPVVYLLHGFLGSYDFYAWSMNAFAQGIGLDLGLSFAAIADSLVAAGQMGEMIVVMPDGTNRYGGGWYENSPVIGNYREYVTQDLVTYIEGKYRTLPTRDSRAIAGHSMGGFGALSLAMEHPELYGAVAAIAPGWPNDFSLSPTPVDAFVADNPESPGTPVLLDITKETTELLPVAALVFTTTFSTNALYSMAAAFSPNPANPPYYVDLPVHYPDKTVVADVWERWVAKDLVHQIAERGASLASTPVFVTQGVGPTVLMAELPHVDRVVAALQASGVSVTYDVAQGDHLTGLREEVSQVLTFLSARLAGALPTAADPASWGAVKRGTQE